MFYWQLIAASKNMVFSLGIRTEFSNLRLRTRVLCRERRPSVGPALRPVIHSSSLFLGCGTLYSIDPLGQCCIRSTAVEGEFHPPLVDGLFFHHINMWTLRVPYLWVEEELYSYWRLKSRHKNTDSPSTWRRHVFLPWQEHILNVYSIDPRGRLNTNSRLLTDL
jgi:hypothetical protein